MTKGYRSFILAVENPEVHTDRKMTVDERFDRLEQLLQIKFDRIDRRFEQVGQGFEQMGSDLAQVRTDLEHFEQYVLDFRTEVGRQFEIADHLPGVLANGVSSMESRIPALSKAATEFGAVVGQLTKVQPRPLDSSTDLIARVAKHEEQVAKLIDRAA